MFTSDLSDPMAGTRREPMKGKQPYLAHIERAGWPDPDSPESAAPRLMTSSHWHDYIEVIYATSGLTVLILDGRTFRLKPGDMVFINTREVHLIYGYEGASYICLRFDPEILYATAPSSFEYRYLRPLTDREFKPQQFYTADELRGSGLDSLIWSAYREIQAKDFGYELAVRASLTRIYLWVLRDWKARGMIRESGEGLTERQIAVLQKVFDYVDENYASPITAQDAADAVDMSYSYFSRFFKRAVGKSFTDYLTSFRLLEAEKRLMRSDDSITDITASVGFTSSSYFIAQFRRAKGESPLQYRKRLMSIQPPVAPDSRLEAAGQASR